MHILIANTQPDLLLRSARFVSLFAQSMVAEITVLGVYTNAPSKKGLETAISEIETTMDCQTKLVEATDAVAAIVEEIETGDYTLLAVGTYKNRRFKRSRAQVQVRQIIHMVPLPVLIVPEERQQLTNVLICTAGTAHGELDTWVGGTLAAAVNAQVMVLHVMSQLPLIAAAYEADLNRDAMEMIKHNTREGRHLKKVMGILYQAGLPDEKYTLKIRHGLVLDEIKRESREGDYDLVVVGAHEVPESKSWNEIRELIQDDITGRLLAITRRPVLVVKAGENGIRWPS